MLRILLVAALLALPAFAHAAPVCAGPSLLTVCANVPDEPFLVDAGEARAENGTAIAIARGDIAAGITGPVVFVASWHFAQAASSYTHSFTASLTVATRNGVVNATQVSLQANASSSLFVDSGTMRVTLADDDLLASGGEIVLTIQQQRFGQTASQLLARAESRAPITVLAAPEARTVATTDLRAGDAFTVGSVHIERGHTDVALHDGATVVATGTALRLVLDGSLDMEPMVGPYDWANSHAYVNLMVSIADGPSYMVSRAVAGYSCWSACSVPGHAGPFSVDLLVPGDALDARRPITVSAWAGENHGVSSSAGYQSGSSSGAAAARHVAYVVGA